MRDLGSIPSPQNSFILNLGLETLPLRVERHCENALAQLQKYLQAHEKVAWVSCPMLKGINIMHLLKNICQTELVE